MSCQAPKFAPNASMLYFFLLAMLLRPCTVVATDEHPPYKPLVARIGKDSNTSLYTISISKNGAPLVVDLAGSTVWSTCPSTHSTVPCESDTCRVANQQRPRRCRYVDAGWFGANREPGWGCACTGHPFNPVTGECSIGDLTSFAMAANATNGSNTLYPVELSAVVGSCAPRRLLRSLPAGAAGVAGFSRWPLSLPSQLSSQRAFGNKFALCLPIYDSYPGFALFGNTSVHLRRHLPELTSIISYTPLVRNPRNGAYYLPVKSISVWWEQNVQVSLPAGALDVNVNTGRGGVVLSTVTPYMTLRSDVYRAFIQAYDTAVRGNSYEVKRMEPVRPFELCYSEGLRPAKRFGFEVPWISLELAGSARSWTVPNTNYIVAVGGWAVCVGVVEMAPPVEDVAPAVVLGGMQLEEHLLVFDLDKGVLGFSYLLWHMETSCSAFNFTPAVNL